jgi:predicted metalloprotease
VDHLLNIHTLVILTLFIVVVIVATVGVLTILSRCVIREVSTVVVLSRRASVKKKSIQPMRDE